MGLQFCINVFPKGGHFLIDTQGRNLIKTLAGGFEFDRHLGFEFDRHLGFEFDKRDLRLEFEKTIRV